MHIVLPLSLAHEALLRHVLLSMERLAMVCLSLYHGTNLFDFLLEFALLFLFPEGTFSHFARALITPRLIT